MTYQEILKSKSADKKTSGAILCVLVSDVHKRIKPEDNRASLSKTIREECGFNKAVADHLATLFLGVYSAENKMEWKSKSREGLSSWMSRIRSIQEICFGEIDPGEPDARNIVHLKQYENAAGEIIFCCVSFVMRSVSLHASGSMPCAMSFWR